MRGQILAYGGLVKRTVECRNEEHYGLGAHTEIKHYVSSRQVGELEQRTENDY